MCSVGSVYRCVAGERNAVPLQSLNGFDDGPVDGSDGWGRQEWRGEGQAGGGGTRGRRFRARPFRGASSLSLGDSRQQAFHPNGLDSRPGCEAASFPAWRGNRSAGERGVCDRRQQRDRGAADPELYR